MVIQDWSLMKIFLGEKQSGKTQQLILLAHKDNEIYLVVQSKDMASQVFARSQEMNCDIRFPMTYDDLISANYPMGFQYKVLIDNLEQFIHHVIKGVPIYGFSLNLDFQKDVVIALKKDEITYDK